MTENKHWGIVGGGILGMYLAHKLSQRGEKVTLLESQSTLGGLTKSWKTGAISWDIFYHVILLSDTTLRSLLQELGLNDKMKWISTKSGFYTGEKLYSMSNSFEFLQFPPLSLLDKLRLGFTIFYASRLKNWKALENVLVEDWLRKWSGNNTFEKIWLPLLRAKLGESYRHTSAAFIWATIQRMYAARRTGLKKEMFGYVEGGYKQILSRFAKHLASNDVEIQTDFRVKTIKSLNMEVVVEDDHGKTVSFDEVIVTTPSHVAADICHDLTLEEKEKHQQIEYLGVICASVLIKKSLSPFYVTNITDKTPFTGIIEMTNLVDRKYFNGHHLVYLPRYVKKDDPLFAKSDQEIKEHFWNYLLSMYNDLSESDLVAFQVARNPYVFALSTLNYSENLPEISTSLSGVHILNSAHIINGTLNVNETLQVVDKAICGILKKAQSRKILAEFL